MTNTELRELLASRVCELIADMAFIFDDVGVTLYEPDVLNADEIEALAELIKSTGPIKAQAREFVNMLFPNEPAKTYDAICATHYRRFKADPQSQL